MSELAAATEKLMMDGMQAYVKDALPGFSLSGRLNKGWSPDNKYLLYSKDGGRCLLRVSGSVTLKRRKETAAMMRLALSAGIRAPRPIHLGCFPDGSTYILQTWLEGVPLDEMLSGLNKQKQYCLGREAGRMLAELNNAPTDVESADFGVRRLRKLHRKLDVYSKSAALVPKAEEALQFIRDNIELLRDRPSLPQHGDFHPGNMLLDEGQDISLIDFDRCGFGDPYEEFYKAQMFARPLSEPFINGQVHGYFDDSVPEDFWELFKLYLAEAVFYSPVWALPFGREQVDHLTGLSRMATDDFGGFRLTKPIWYREPEAFTNRLAKPGKGKDNSD